MECLADFGTVSFFSVQTLTTAIYNSWLAFDDLNTSFQSIIVCLIINNIDSLFYRKLFQEAVLGTTHASQGFKNIPKIKLKGSCYGLQFFYLLLFILSFIFPTSQMLYWTIKFPNIFKISIY